MSADIVDARFAGGSITVTADDEYTGDGAHGVILDMPGGSVWLFAHEARALSRALARQAVTE